MLYGCSYDIVLHPTEDAAMLDGGAGQDGAFLWQVLLTPEGLSVRALDTDDRIMGGFSPDGTRFVTAPHHGDAICIHRWPDGEVIDRLEADRVFLDDGDEAAVDHFDYRAVFLDDRHVIADTRQRRLLLLATGPLRVEAGLRPEGTAIRGYGDRGQPVDDPAAARDYQGDLEEWLVARDKLLTTHSCSPYTSDRLSLWDLSSSSANDEQS